MLQPASLCLQVKSPQPHQPCCIPHYTGAIALHTSYCVLLLLLLSLLQVAFSAHTRHPNIVQLLDVFADKERRTLVIVVRALLYL
jgi:hypothetical protein